MNDIYFLSSPEQVPLNIFSCIEREDVEVKEVEEAKLKLIDVFNYQLTKVERAIVWQRFGFAGSEKRLLDEVGRDFSITRERVRCIERRGIRKMAYALRLSIGA